jgi:hypothetical protein
MHVHVLCYILSFHGLFMQICMLVFLCLCHSEFLCSLQSYPSMYVAYYFLTHIGPPCSLYPSPISVVPMETILVSTPRVESN